MTRFYMVMYDKAVQQCAEETCFGIAAGFRSGCTENCKQLKVIERQPFCRNRAGGGSSAVACVYNTAAKARAQATRLNKGSENLRSWQTSPKASVMYFDTEDLIELGAHVIDDPVACAEAKVFHYAKVMEDLEKNGRSRRT